MSTDNTVRTMVELPNELIERIYALESYEETIQDRIEEMVQHFEPAVRQCAHESAPNSDGVVLRCLRNAGHDGDHCTTSDLQEVAG